MRKRNSTLFCFLKNELVRIYVSRNTNNMSSGFLTLFKFIALTYRKRDGLFELLTRSPGKIARCLSTCVV